MTSKEISKFSILFLFFIFSCIEPYEFVISNNYPSLVVEAYISDKSFSETLSYPSDGRYFNVNLSQTSDVTNTRPAPVTGAVVKLVSDENEWTYTETGNGRYTLYDNEFKAVTGTNYKLRVQVAEAIYESKWTSLPDHEKPVVGDIGFRENERLGYVIEQGEPVVRTIKEIVSNVEVQKNQSGKPLYYRWKFTPTWVYKPPFSPGNTSPGNTCWISEPNYLNSYALQEDYKGEYKTDLFSIQTVRNERIYEDLSVLVIQYNMRDDFYSFWKGMKDQNEGNTFFDIPPFNLESNFHCITDDKPVSGFFGVVYEDAKRWYFNKNDLSYAVENTLRADCLVDYGPPLPGCPIPLPAMDCACKYCLANEKGSPTDVRPEWWRK